MNDLKDFSREGDISIHTKQFVDTVGVTHRVTAVHISDRILAYFFGFVFVSAILASVLVVPNPTDAQFEIFRIIIALAAGGIAVVIPGLLRLKTRLNLGKVQYTTLTGSGALAVFLIVYFYSPARWNKNQVSDIKQPVYQNVTRP